MSLLGVDLLKLCATRSGCSPGDLCNKGGCWSMTPEGSLVVLVHGGCEIEVPNALPSLGKANMVQDAWSFRAPSEGSCEPNDLHLEAGLFYCRPQQ